MAGNCQRFAKLSLIEMIKRNFYVITGGPGGGKSSLLDCLASKGYGHIPETARQLIKERVLQNLSPRPDAEVFAMETFHKDWTNFSSNLQLSSPLFFDRSFMDSAWLLFKAEPRSFIKIQKVCLKNRFNNRVFITPPWEEIYCNDNERDQSFNEAIEVYEQLGEWYEQHDYDLIVLPKDSIENRVKFIFEHM